MPNSSLSPEAIKILKELHGKTKIRFETVEEGEAFVQEARRITERDAQSPNGLYLPYCYDSLLWLEDDEGKEYLGLPISNYGRGATKALHAVGVI